MSKCQMLFKPYVKYISLKFKHMEKINQYIENEKKQIVINLTSPTV